MICFELSVQKAGQKVLFGTLEEITIQTGANTLNFGTLQNITMRSMVVVS